MSTLPDSSAEELQALRLRLEALEAERALNRAADEVLEVALRDRLPLHQAMARMLPLLLEHLQARAVWVRTFDETLKMHDFPWPVDTPLPVDLEEVVRVTGQRRPYIRRVEGGTVLGQHLDVAGDLFGATAVWMPADLAGDQEARVRTLLDTWCEELDNYLAFIAHSRRKYRVTTAIGDALRDPILDRGIDRALDVLAQEVPFEDLLLVFRHEEDMQGPALRYKIIQDGVRTHDSRIKGDMEVDEFIRSHASRLIQADSRDLLRRFGIERYREEVLLSGVRDDSIVGRLAVTNRAGEFNTFDRDLLQRFSDFLNRRIVDFNKDWRLLSLCFPDDVVDRLLSQEDWPDRLVPSEQQVAILFSDISGFTRISEQVLRDPELIGRLVDTWAARVVEMVWESGGVFDKMVGDCVIAMWGPPFNDIEPGEATRRAAEVAMRIRDYTSSLGDGQAVPQLAGVTPPIGVATGLNFCPLFVGRFGPNEDYTGFSSGMNNTARLQGIAERDEILCTDLFVAALGDADRFGEERSAKVKNVADPLRFRALVG